ncbi:MAG: hypothetical protein BM562_16630 [Alphaproteobacteria bacterium MedPE-SWcel]|nr:MAG: hypothetical protein BM562_16630 [Alphaproteobacteria bacterium MedPE-SWcel]
MKDTPATPPPKPSVHLDFEDWLPYLEHEDATEAEKIEFVETLWNIAVAFVDLGWDLNSNRETGGQSLDLTAVLRAAVVNSNDKEAL